MTIVTMGPYGRVRIPDDVRKAAGLTTGNDVEVEVGRTHVRARVKVLGGQLTVPVSRKILTPHRIYKGDLIEVEVPHEGLIRLRSLASRPTGVAKSRKRSPEQAWFWKSGWLAGERQAERDIAQGRMRTFRTAQGFLASLGTEDEPSAGRRLAGRRRRR